MKKLLFVFLSLFFAGLSTYAGNISSDFHHRFNKSALSSYNRDLSTLIGQNDFFTPQGTSFPGASIGASFNAVKASKANDIADDYLYTGFLMAETKLPILNLEVALRGTDVNGLESIGAGLKYNIDFLEVVHLAIAGFYDRASSDYFKQDHFSVSAMASASLVLFTPFVGVGYDYGDIKTKNFADNTSSSDNNMRYTAGISYSWLPFTSIFASYTQTNYTKAYQAGVNVKF